MFHLLIATSRGESIERKLSGDTIIVGRSSSVDLCIKDSSISRCHARFFREAERWFVEDMGSRNGSLVNGEELLSAQALRSGDRITIGDTVITVTEAHELDGISGSALTAQTVFRSAADILEERVAADGMNDIGRLRRLADRLQILNDVNRALSGPITPEELLEFILSRVFSELRPEQGAVFLKDDSGGFYCASHRGARAHDVMTLCSRHLVQEVVEKGQAALVNDTLLDERFQDAASLIDAGVQSFLAAPLLGPEGARGLIVLCSKPQHRMFNEEDMELLTSLASLAAMRLQNMKLVQAEAERQRSLALARKIQVALLPSTLPQIPGYTLHAGNIPSLGVSGDFYKVVSRAEGREILLMLADATGKGIGASLLTGVLESLSAAPIENGWPPDKIFNTVSRLLWDRTSEEKYATAVLVLLEPELGLLHYVNAGHPPGLLLRGGSAVDHLSSTGLPVGLFPEAQYSTAQTHMAEGDTLILYSDGITEAENPEDEEFGRQRLEKLSIAHQHEELPELARQIEKELSSFAGGVPFADDRTLLLLRRHNWCAEEM